MKTTRHELPRNPNREWKIECSGCVVYLRSLSDGGTVVDVLADGDHGYRCYGCYADQGTMLVEVAADGSLMHERRAVTISVREMEVGHGKRA
jgi:hypothetical protein